MSERMALKAAIDLMHVPSQVRLFRSEPLPDGVLLLLRLAAGDPEADQIAIDLTGRSHETVRRAATFFIEQILFAPDADSYRVLGADARASAAELRRNVGLLIKWLHPDVDHGGDRSVFVGRVTAAWNNLKTPERRAAYDELSRYRASRGKSRSGKGGRSRRFVGSAAAYRRRAVEESMATDGASGFLRRALSALFYRPQQ